jgi:hypothetical protein
MSEADKTRSTVDDPAVRNYTIFCLGCLSLLLLALLRKNAGPWGFIPVVVGLLGVWQHWRLGPFFTLITVVILLVSHEPVGDINSRTSPAARTFRLTDCLLCMSALGYVIGQFRLQALVHAIVPADPRRRREPPPDASPNAPAPGMLNRDPRLAQPAEIAWVVMALPICALFAQVLWRLLPARTSWSVDFHTNWRVLVPAIVCAWFLIIGLFVAQGLLRYVGWQQQTPREARLTLLDTYWQEIRRELRRISHWLAWAQSRRQRRKDPS